MATYRRWGNSLSRGLTLEGLCTSYFYRSSQAYDTLLQMGQWFGYRPGYADLCCLWMTADAQQWYAHLALISEELRGELRRMKRLDMTPREFGLKVRTHPDTLLVTAGTQNATAETVTKRISWSGEAAETSKVWTRSNSANVKIVRDFLFSLRKNGYGPQESEWSTPIFRSVPGRFVADLLSSFDIHPLNFQLSAVRRRISRHSGFRDLSGKHPIPNWRFGMLQYRMAASRQLTSCRLVFRCAYRGEASPRSRTIVQFLFQERRRESVVAV